MLTSVWKKTTMRQVNWFVHETERCLFVPSSAVLLAARNLQAPMSKVKLKITYFLGVAQGIICGPSDDIFTNHSPMLSLLQGSLKKQWKRLESQVCQAHQCELTSFKAGNTPQTTISPWLLMLCSAINSRWPSQINYSSERHCLVWQ